MKKQHLQLADNDLQELESLLSKSSLTVKFHSRVKILLALNQGKTFRQIEQELLTTYPTIIEIRDKYLNKKEGDSALIYLADKARTGRPPGISGEERAKITALACSQAPEGYAKWSLRLLSDKIVELGFCDEISHTYVGKILKKTTYNPI